MKPPAAKKPSPLAQRILSALCLIPLVIFALAAGGWVLWALVVPAFILSLYEWGALARKCPNTPGEIALGAAYLLICFGAFLWLRFGFAETGIFLTLALVFGMWASDTGAYIVGKTIGGRKLAPRLSPKKTWAGFAGAVICCGCILPLAFIALQALYYSWIGWGVGAAAAFSVAGAAVPKLFAAGCVLGATGQAGDLFISRIKRRAGVKDTGHLIPGHGGILDRIDSLLLASPVFLIFVRGFYP